MYQSTSGGGTNLNLYHNDIGAEGASQLAEALKVNTSITNLSLDHNYIGAEGASQLVEALKVNTSITNLNLARNNIGKEGASQLAKALKDNIKYFITKELEQVLCVGVAGLIAKYDPRI